MTSNSPVSVVPLRPVACGAVVWRLRGRLRVTVIVKATFGLVHQANARLVAPLPLVAADQPRGGRHDASLELASELAPYVPNAGIVALASAHTAGGTPVPVAAVGLRVAADRPLVDKTLHVFGDRASPQAHPSPFTSMPIVWERAYGGPGYLDNPAGVGATGDRAPNIVDPADARRPAGFGPIAPSWTPRAARPRPPDPTPGGVIELPDSFDFSHYQAAPADQCAPYLRGDEWIVLDGMHPELARLQTRLPSATAQARWSVQTALGEGPVSALELVLDTLALDVDRQLGCAVWRGHFVADHAESLGRLRVLAGVELPGYPIPWPEGARNPAPPPGGPTSLVEDAPTTQERPSPFASPRTGDLDLRTTPSALPFARADGPPPSSARSRPIEAQPKGVGLGDTTSGVRAPAFLSGDALPFLPPGSAAPSPQTLGNTAQGVVSPFARPLAPFAIAPPRASSSEASAPIPGAPWSNEPAAPAPDPEGVLEGPTLLLASPFSSRAPASEPRPTSSLEPLPVPSEALPPAPVAVSPPPTPPTIADDDTPPAEVPDPRFRPAPVHVPLPPPASSRRPPLPLAPAAPLAAPPVPPPPSPSSPAAAEPADPSTALRARLLELVRAGQRIADLPLAGADLTGLDLGGAHLAGANLVGADLSGATLNDADLDRADLSRATLVGAKLERARLNDTNLSGARGNGASFDGATGQRTVFTRGTWDDATFRGAELRNPELGSASLARADLSGAVLVDMKLDDAKAEGLILTGARAPQLRAQGAHLDGAQLDRLDAPGSIWERASLVGASFVDAQLRGATLTRATCTRAVLRGADLEGATLQRLTAPGADFSDAKLAGADLRQSRAGEARFEGAVLRQVNLGKSELAAACFDGADLSAANLRESRLPGASLVSATLTGADLRDADLTGADLRGAALEGAKLAGANRTGAREGAAPDDG